MTKPLWFKAKRYGWGWYPATWQGWLVTLGFVVAILLNSMTIDRAAEPPMSVIVPWLVTNALFVFTLIGICYLTGEKPRWRWGGKD